MRRRLFALLALVPLIIWYVGSDHPSQFETDRMAYRNFIKEHPFNHQRYSDEEIASIPKQDRPDLAMQQNYLMTLDPKLGEVPSNRLIESFSQTKARISANSFKSSFNQQSPLTPGNSSQGFNQIQAPSSVLNLYRSYQDFLNNTRESESSNGFTLSDKKSENSTNSTSISAPTELEGAAIANVTWQERGPDNVGGRTRALMWDPNDTDTKKLWAAGVAGGIWYNNDVTDANTSWQAVNDFLANMAVTTLAYDPTNTQTFYAGTGEGFFNADAVRGAGIFKSTDGGATWSQLAATTGSSFYYVQKIVVTSSGTVLAATREGGGIQRSTDGGATWTSVLNSSSGAATSRGADLEIAANGDIYASMGIFSSGSIHRSTDDGQTWTNVSPGTGSPQRIELAIAPSASSQTSTTVIYAVASNGSNVEWFQKSTDGGANWTSLTIPEYREQNCATNGRDFTRGQAWYDLILAVKPDNPDVVLAGGINVLRSDDGGSTMAEVSYWTGACDPEVHADQHAIAFRPGFPAQAVFGHDGGVSYSSDVGVVSSPSFENRNKNYAVTQFYAVAAQNTAGSGYFLAGAQDNGTQQLSDANGLSSVEVTGGDGAFTFIDQDDPNYQISSYVYNVYYLLNANGGFVGTLSNNQSSGRFINPADYDNTANILYSAGNTDELNRISGIASTPGAQETVSVDLGGSQISAVRADANTANRIFVGTDAGSIFRIDDAESATPTVTEITNDIGAFGYVSSIDVGATDDQLLVTLSNYGVNSVWYSSNGGTNWINKDDTGHGLPDMPVRWGLFNPTNNAQVLLATELGVWSTNDITASNPGWEPTNERLANVRCDMLQYRAADGLVVVGTHGRGVFTTDVFVATADVTAPQVVNLTPNDGATMVGLNPTIEIEFDEPIVEDDGVIIIAIDGANTHFINIPSGIVSTTLATASFQSPAEFPANAEITISASVGSFADNYGNEASAIEWSFNTSDGDEPPVVALPIDDYNVFENSGNINVDLTAVFDDPDNDNASITFEASASDNSIISLDDVSDGELTISLNADKIGSTEVTITATSNGKTVDDVFAVNVSPNQSSLFVQSTPGSGNGQLEGAYLDAVSRNADDFIVPGGEQWTVNTVQTEAFSLGPDPFNLQSVIVEIYADNAGAPGSTLFEQDVLVGTGQIIGGTQSSPSLTVRLNSDVMLDPGTYWISIFPQFNANAFGSPYSALYAWYQQTTGGNAHQAASAEGAYSPIDEGLGFTVLGDQTITDAAPVFDNPISDVELAPNPDPVVIDLNNRVSDADDDDAAITFEVFNNTNAGLVTTDLVDRTLTLTIAADTEGSADITIRATSDGLTVDDVFTVTVEQPSAVLYSQSGDIIGTTPSQIFPDFGNLALEAADNFTVPDREVWNIRKVSVEGAGVGPSQAVVLVYDDQNGSVGAPIYASDPLNVEATINSTSFEVTLADQLTLPEGQYWISVQTFQAFSGGNQWFWGGASPSINGDHQWQDLAGLLGSPFTWTPSGDDSALIFDIAGGTCDTPTGLSIDNVDQVTVDLSWDETEADSYNIRYRDRADLSVPWTEITGIATNSTEIIFPTEFAEFNVEVSSVCGGIATKYGSKVKVTTGGPGGQCEVPTALSLDNVNIRDVDISWSNIASADSYDLRYKDRADLSAPWTEIINISATNSASFTLPDEVAEYNINVRSVCSDQVTDWSQNLYVVTGTSEVGCDIPSGLTADNIDVTDIDLSWNPIASADNFDLRYKRRGTTDPWTELINVSATASASITLPLESTDYNIQVRTVCGDLVTNWSQRLRVITGVSSTVAESSTSSQSEQVQVEFDVYPNPVTEGRFQMLLNRIVESPEVRLISLDGRNHPVKINMIGSTRLEVIAGVLPQGIYVVELQSEGIITQRSKLIVK